MASSSGKPTAVHFSLIFFVMTTIIAGVIAYLMYSSLEESTARFNKETDDLRAQTELSRNRDDAIQALKARSGHEYAEVGDANTPNTVLWALANDIRAYGGYPPSTAAAQLPTVHDTLIELRRQLDQLQSQYNKAAADLQARDATILGLEDKYRQLADEANKGREDEKTIRVAVESNQAERLEAASQKYEEKVAELAAERGEHEQDNARYEKQVASLEEENKNLVAINLRIREKLDGIQKYSFEVPDGEIRWVDHVSGLVWINLGSADRLSKGTTFSVYTKPNKGIGRGTEDIKGAIEVTDIVGPHLAEARLTDTDIYRPIAPGDPVYTPLWSAGRSEQFAIVGFIDVDSDGKSDRKLLKNFIETAGAEFHVEITDEGQRLPDEEEKITEQTKFLVVADLPDPTTTADANEKKLYFAILEEFSKLEKEARQQGVRKISLSDFLAYVGYRHSRRLWRPGEAGYGLNSGSRSTGVDEINIKRGGASGQTSGVYSRSERLGQQSSTGNTSGAFRGGSYDN